MSQILQKAVTSGRPIYLTTDTMYRHPRQRGGQMSRHRPDPGEEYEVGYAKPPAQHRFKPGQSGNPKGRPRGARGVATLVNEALDETIQVNAGGRPREMKKREALLTAMIAKAIKGDVRAASLVVKLMETHDPEPAQDGETIRMATIENPREKIERMLAQLREAQGIPDDDDGDYSNGYPGPTEAS